MPSYREGALGQGLHRQSVTELQQVNLITYLVREGNLPLIQYDKIAQGGESVAM